MTTENKPESAGPTFFFSVGEPSGDLHAANLIRDLQKRCKTVRAVGYGGPEMANAGCELHTDLTKLAVMWFLRVLLNYHKFWLLVKKADRYFRDEKPDAVILVDYPGFNWHIARSAKKRGIPVFYYTPPQIWSWARWRVKKMRASVDHVLCSLPFEEPWFKKRGCNATYVGHPFFDEVQRQPLDEAFMEEQKRLDNQIGPLVTILPGSRTQEVEHNLHWFLMTAEKVKQRVDRVRFAVAAFRPHQAELAEKLIKEKELECEVHVGKTSELMASAHCCMACSGSVSLEILHYERPTVILYWISRFAYSVQERFRWVKYITLVNMLSAGGIDIGDLADDNRVAPPNERLSRRELKKRISEGLKPFDPTQPDADSVLFPEYLTWEDKTEQLATHLIEWLEDESAYQRRVGQLHELNQRVGHPGASAHAAKYILDSVLAHDNANQST